MPTVFRVTGFRFYFWSHELNEPPHVHVDRSDASAKFWLAPVSLASNRGYGAHDLGVILRLVRRHRPELLKAWHEFFGTG